MTQVVSSSFSFKWLPALLTLSALLGACGSANVPGTLSGNSASGSGAGAPSVNLANLPLQRFALPVSNYQASSLRVAGGQVYVLPTVNAPDPQRHTVISLDIASGAAKAEALPLADEEGFTSQAVAPDGTRYLMIQNVAGNWVGAAKVGEALKKMPLGTPGDNLNFLTRTPDGRLWSLQYRQDALFELSVQSGVQQSHPVEDNAEDLTADAGGVLYYSRFLTNPAVIRFDPASGQTRSYPVGVKGKTRPRLLTATAQSVWFVDSWTRKLSRIDTGSGSISELNVPAGAILAALSASADGTLWASDVARHALYRWQPGQLSAQSLSVPGDGPRALEVESGGTVWFESAGALYRLSP
ncbi:hypothetical protein EHF33_10095 [Deinococcus psychrotolerans]|uniref:Uncharacterized protein n=1 Tax=Deinococcus psychrotolerans TaxID=2489213 RepID=A0A3G8YN79_9DEIO|nr:hypothetical protein [Deinococcus psychrotolerans]AZI43051.1 hypothetical protein EHF33_10095 [Deinococcus psychrotolerans]